MLVSEFDYELPSELIAQKPTAKRDQSRMMVLERKSGKISHCWFKDFPFYLKENDVLVLNDSRVIPSRIWGKKDGKEIEFLFLKECQKGIWEVLCRPARKVNINDTICFSPGFEGKVISKESEGKRKLQVSEIDVIGKLKDTGSAPLPPYIKRKKNSEYLRAMDIERYQTVFAEKYGSIAAPTAGLHFTQGILKKIKEKGVKIVRITLDVGLATFQPVRVERTEDNKMLEESFRIEEKAASIINDAKKNAHTVVAVGTTSVRVLESAFDGEKICPKSSSTNLFITPGYRFSTVDKLLTNFHMPKSTLIMLASAFAGYNFLMKAYNEAVKHRYRFFSYGDSMLII